MPRVKGKVSPFARNLAGLRVSKGLTQWQLADLAGCNRVTIARIEGDSTSGRDTYDRIIDALNKYDPDDPENNS